AKAAAPRHAQPRDGQSADDPPEPVRQPADSGGVLAADVADRFGADRAVVGERADRAVPATGTSFGHEGSCGLGVTNVPEEHRTASPSPQKPPPIIGAPRHGVNNRIGARRGAAAYAQRGLRWTRQYTSAIDQPPTCFSSSQKWART